jgi:hypothetical protein
MTVHSTVQVPTSYQRAHRSLIHLYCFLPQLSPTHQKSFFTLHHPPNHLTNICFVKQRNKRNTMKFSSSAVAACMAAAAIATMNVAAFTTSPAVFGVSSRVAVASSTASPASFAAAFKPLSMSTVTDEVEVKESAKEETFE